MRSDTPPCSPPKQQSSDSHKAERKSHRGALVCIGTFPHKNMPSRPQQIAVSPKFIETEKLKQNEKAELLFQLKDKRKILKKTVKQIKNLPDKEFKTLVIKMLTELRKRININSEHFNKEVENIKTQSEMNDSIAKIKKTH